MKVKSERIERREFIGGVVATSAIAASHPVSLPQTHRPNVLFILADDLGYGDLSCFGRCEFQKWMRTVLSRALGITEPTLRAR